MNKKAFKFLFFAFCILFSAFSVAQTNENLMKKAETLYNNQDYEQALAVYLTLESKFAADWKLNYNIGNTYFKLADFPHAILYYERAKKLNPCDKDLNENLKITNARLKGETYALPDFFVWTWIKTISGQFFPKTWAIITLFILLLACCGFYLYYFAKQYKVFTFYLFVFLSILTLFSFSMGLTRSYLINQSDYAVIFDANGIIKDENTEQTYGKQKNIKLFNGEKVQIIEKQDKFLIIETPDGNKVKITPNALQII
ncbi:MAG: tetratricopeptide repeat protein [Bacteroidales bacterium]|jgi:tetratricopeptide (TPR) repeat protein|nr:tetratricopeptide repeat protein [Bacteroidales bacterium]